MKKDTKLLVAIVVLIVALLIWFVVRSPKDRDLAGRTAVRFQLQWTPQAQFVGFYVAQAKDYYAAEGLAVDFSHGGPDINPILRLVQDQVDIGLATADQILVWQHTNQKQNVALKALGTVFYRNMAVFLSHHGSNLMSPTSLQGKRVGVYPSYDTENVLLAMLQKASIAKDSVQMVAFPNLQEFLTKGKGAVDAFPAYLINEPLRAAQEGIVVDPLDPEAFGVKFYSDTFFSTATYVSKNQNTISKFLRASAKGWDYAAAHPDEALDLMYKVVGPALGTGKEKELQGKMVKETLRYIRPKPDSPLFRMDETRWEAMADALAKIGRIDKKELFREVCDFSAVEKAGIR